MSAYFLDTSALAKRYIHENGSQWIETIVDPVASHSLIVARLSWVELLSALARLHRENRISAADLATTIQIAHYDWQASYHIVEIDQALTEKAGRLVQKYPLRAYDAVQLASALTISPVFSQNAPHLFSFVSADGRLLEAAQGEGLPVINPQT